MAALARCPVHELEAAVNSESPFRHYWNYLHTHFIPLPNFLARLECDFLPR